MVPLSFKYLIDHAIAEHDRQILVQILLGLTIGVIVVSAAGILHDYLYARVVSGALQNIRTDMFRQMQGLSAGALSRKPAGDILAHFSSDLAAVEHGLATVIPWAILPALSVAVSTILLFGIEWRLALVASLVWPLALTGPRLISRKATAAGYRKKLDESRLLAEVQEAISSHGVVRAFGVEEFFLRRFQRRLARLVAASLRLGFLSSLLERSAGIGILVTQVIVMGVGAVWVFHGRLSLGSLVAFHGLFVLMSESLFTLTEFLPYLTLATSGFQRVDELLKARPHVVERQGAVVIQPLSKAIRFTDVTFGYHKGRPNLSGVTFTVRAGDRVAVVGPSGSGKSTVINLLARFYDVGAGSVALDDVDVREATVSSVRRQLGIVFQDSPLFNATVRENILVGQLQATEEDMTAAASTAGIHDFISGLPRGYDTVLGPDGLLMSSGQRQRIAIARAVIGNPAVLVLDEATSALDPEGEAAIQATLRRIAKGRTVLSVTHRLAQVMDADHILVLEKGRLIEQGRHEELLAQAGLYAKLWEKQAGFFVSRDLERVTIDPARLRAVPLLAGLDDPARAAVAALFVSERHPSGRIVFEQGDPGDRFYIIVRGSVSVSAGAGEIAVLEDGDYFGEIALLEQNVRSATVRTRSDALFLTLTRAQFLALLEREPGLRRALEKEARERRSGRAPAAAGGPSYG
jgi:ATP-binding cassette subfamily B protein